MKANNGAAIYSMNYGERIFRRGELSIAISEHLNDPNNSRLKNLRRCRRNFVSEKISSKAKKSVKIHGQTFVLLLHSTLRSLKSPSTYKISFV